MGADTQRENMDAHNESASPDNSSAADDSTVTDGGTPAETGTTTEGGTVPVDATEPEDSDVPVSTTAAGDEASDDSADPEAHETPESTTTSEGEQTPTDGAAREAKALEELADRLNKEYADKHSEESVASAIDKALNRFHGHAVRDFVPILVERIARRELEGESEESGAESTSAPSTADPGTTAPEPTNPSTEDPDTGDSSTAETDPHPTAAATTGPGTSDSESTVVAATNPDTNERPASEIAATNRGTNEPSTAEAATIGPDAANPDTGEPNTTATATTAPDVSDPSTSDPSTTAKSATAPGTNEPSTSDPDPTETATTAPDATNLVTTNPDTSDPNTAETATTEPDVSDPIMSTPGTTDPGTNDSGRTSPEPTGIADRLRSGARNLVRGPLTGAHILVAALVAIVLILLFVHPHTTGGSENNTATSTSVITVHGVVGSEKLAYFGDPKVIDALAKHGLRVQVEPAGSRQIATSVNLGKYDFAFPSSEPAAETILRERNLTTKYTPFSSPMAIATFKPIADLLTAAGVVHPGPVPSLDMNRYLQLVDSGTQWNQLPGNTVYPVPKNVLVSTTDPRTSNSADMYLAIASYVANDDTIVRGPVAEANAVDKISKLFVGQGYSDNSSAGPFDQYLSTGMGPTPMVLIYEAQYVEAAVQGRITPDMELLYPSPTVLSRHTLVPLDSAGDRLGRLLTSDPDLQALAAQHGFRTNDPAQFAKVTSQHNVPVTPQVVDAVDAPAYDTLQHLLDGVSKAYS